MAERFRREDDVVPTSGARGATTVTDDEQTRVHDTDRDRVELPDRLHDHDGDRHGAVDRGTMAAVRERQRERFGGIKCGSACFGWLTAIGLG
ncbi:MAG TPA: hypothetical protein VG318_08070, partial [Actinomycetota bacterium]|nr:hypothetical protein [Actinomycetota bacterium]